ncbi:hypothetical protein OG497_37755 [Streptomyces sp. NBC_01242]|uniref:hypothetical protein n=1 Tax=Streptomyces sp. NBC_01242 TaxID=2903795 RepID=UPI0022543B56|nr:hypothetical protein [Streptomyces sp. NBC_01242]MCX4799604.1 hypothetical protein [Streptomyces sp. NBC_01242]
MDPNARRKAIVAIVTGVLIFATIICAAEFGTGADNPLDPARTVTIDEPSPEES